MFQMQKIKPSTQNGMNLSLIFTSAQQRVSTVMLAEETVQRISLIKLQLMPIQNLMNKK
jgi:hypothetical protein